MLPIYSRTTAPTGELLTDAQLLNFCDAETGAIARLREFESVAIESVEEQTGRALLEQSWTLKIDAWPKEKLELERWPVGSITSVKYWPADGGTQVTLSNTVYRLITGGTVSHAFIELIDGQSWPDLAARSDAVEVVFTAGTVTGNVKYQLKHCVLLLARHFYDAGREVVTVEYLKDVPHSLRDFIASQKIGGHFA